MHVHTTDDPQDFLDHASEFLLTDPVQNSLLLTTATMLARAAQPGTDQVTTQGTPTWAVLSTETAPPDRGEDPTRTGLVVGAAMRTPPHGIVVSRLPAGGAGPLVEALLPTCVDAGSVLGPTPDVEEFADIWSSRTGKTANLGRAQRIYRLDRVFSVAEVAGFARPVKADELELLVDLGLAFATEIGESSTERSRDDARRHARQRIDDGRAHFWDDGGPVAYVGNNLSVGGIVRIGPVYTPPELRGRGYASALTAAVSQTALDGGADACSLYTDLANPTSNQIYAAIGYRPVCDAATYHITD